MSISDEGAALVIARLKEAIDKFSSHGLRTSLAKKLLRAGEWDLAFEELFFLNRKSPDVLSSREYNEIEGAFASVVDLDRLNRISMAAEPGGARVTTSSS